MLASIRGGLPVLVLVVTVVTIFMLFASRPRLMPVETPERVWPVDAIEVSHQAIQPNLELFGEVVAGRRSQLLALVNGRIVEIGENFDLRETASNLFLPNLVEGGNLTLLSLQQQTPCSTASALTQFGI